MPPGLFALVPSSATPTPSPSATAPPDELVTPGFGGFFVIALLVVAVVILAWDMQRRVRRTRYREEVAAELDAQEQQAPRAEASADGEADAAPSSSSEAAPD